MFHLNRPKNLCKLSFILLKNINPEKYIPTFDLINQVKQVKGSNISIHYFRSKIIAKIRDKGVLVTSCNKGYKLPSSKSDLYDFVTITTNHSTND